MYEKCMSAVGFEPTRSKTLRPERNPLDHSGKLTDTTRTNTLNNRHTQYTKHTQHTHKHSANTKTHSHTTRHASEIHQTQHSHTSQSRQSHSHTITHTYRLHNTKHDTIQKHCTQLNTTNRHLPNTSCYQQALYTFTLPSRHTERWSV